MISWDTPINFLIAIAAFVVTIGTLVAVHEFGHFWVARRLGIRVLRFSIGFGRPLWRRTRGKEPVEYVIGAIPLGGYVKMLDEREGNVAPADAARAFNRAPVWKRIAVLLAGPAFNLAFAAVAYWVLFLAGMPTLKPVIGDIAPQSIAAEAGLRQEDMILTVGGRAVETREAALIGILQDLVEDGVIDMRVRGIDGAARDVTLHVGADRRRALTEPEALMPGLGFDFWRPRLKADVARLTPDSAAAAAGVEIGDEILAVDGTEVADFDQLVRLVEPNPGRTVTLTVRRGGALLDLPVTIGADEVAGRTVGRIGVGPSGTPIDNGRKLEEIRAVERYGPLAALAQSGAKTWETSVFTLRMIGRVVTGDVSFKSFAGPITIAEYSGMAARAAQQEWWVFLNWMALISISLGIINLMPIPILDGGQVLFQLAELVKGRPVSERTLLIGQQIGFAAVIVLMTLVLYNDIARHLN